MCVLCSQDVLYRGIQSVGDKAGNLLHVIFPITFFVPNALGSKCSTHAHSSITRFDKRLTDVTNLQKSDKEVTIFGENKNHFSAYAVANPLRTD